MSEVLLPTGGIGWMVRPRLSRAMVSRNALGLLFFALLSVPAFMFGTNVTGALIFDLVITVLIAVATSLYVRNERFIADRSSVGRIDWLGRIRTWPLSDVERVDRVAVVSGSATTPYMFFRGVAGQGLFGLSGRYWDLHRVEGICRTLGLDVTGDFTEKVNYMSSPRSGRWFLVVAALGATVAAVIVFFTIGGH